MSSDGHSWFPLPRRGLSRQDRGAQPADNGAASTATAATTADQVDSAVVDCALYDGGERRAGRVDLDTAMSEAASCDDGFVWIGLHDPSAPVVNSVAKRFDLHPLAVEDAVHAHQRPKLDVFGDSVFMVLKSARFVDSQVLVDVGEVVAFVGPHFAVTVRHGEASPLHDVRLDLEANPDLLAIGPSAVLYAVADRIVDDYAEVIERIAIEVEELESEVFSGSGSNPAERIYRLKREVLEFRRAVSPLVAPIQSLADPETKLPVDRRTVEYFRDILDHLVRDVERIQGFDEMLTGVLQANLAHLTVRANQDMRRISAWVAIIAVPTMVFAIYGMNFDYMPELKWEFGYPLVLVVVLSICAALYWRFKRSGWL